MGCSVCAINCVPRMSMVFCSGRTLVSSCRCEMGVDCVQPVAILSAVFCVRCNVLWCVCAVSGAQAWLAYVIIGLMNCLYSVVIDSLECPYVVFVSARSTLSLCLALVLVSCVCCLNVAPVSYVTPRILVVLLCGMVLLLSVTWGCTVYSLLCGVISVSDDLVGETVMRLCVSQCSSR